MAFVFGTTSSGGGVQTVTLSFFLECAAQLFNITGSGSIFIADKALQLTSVKVVYPDNSNTGATLQIQKLTGTTVPGSGTNLLQSGIALDGTINTVLSGTLTATTANLQFAVGDRIGATFGGSPQSDVVYTTILTLKKI